MWKFDWSRDDGDDGGYGDHDEDDGDADDDDDQVHLRGVLGGETDRREV